MDNGMAGGFRQERGLQLTQVAAPMMPRIHSVVWLTVQHPYAVRAMFTPNRATAAPTICSGLSDSWRTSTAESVAKKGTRYMKASAREAPILPTERYQSTLVSEVRTA